MSDLPPSNPREGSPERWASFQKTRLPGLIWAVPIAVLGIVGWMGLHAYMHSGPSVQVRFPVVGGLHAGRTKVKYHRATVGRVTAVKIARSLRYMTLTIRLSGKMKGHLGKGTRFWVAGKTLSLSHISALKSLISGPYIGIDPHEGPLQSHFQGQRKPPIIAAHFRGETITLVTHHLRHIARGSPVYYHHFKVGRVQGLEILPTGQTFHVYVLIHKPYEHFVQPTTRFWNAGAVHITTGAAGIGLQLLSVPALVTGALAFATHPSSGRPKTATRAVYKIYRSRQAAFNIKPRGVLPYQIIFPGGDHALQPGAAVELEGNRVGLVTRVRSAYNPAQSQLQTHVGITIDPRAIPLVRGYHWHRAHMRQQINTMLKQLIAHGLRAEIGSQTPLIGPHDINLTLVPGAAVAHLIKGPSPIIPSVTSGGVGAIERRVNDILAKINALPLSAIAHNIQKTTRKLAALSQSPQTRETLTDLHRTLSHVDAITASAQRELPGILTEVRRSATNARIALHRARALLAQTPQSNTAADTESLPQTLHALAEAARSLRSLAGYLKRHPSALITGRRP